MNTSAISIPQDSKFHVVSKRARAKRSAREHGKRNEGRNKRGLSLSKSEVRTFSFRKYPSSIPSRFPTIALPFVNRNDSSKPSFSFLQPRYPLNCVR